MTQEPAQPDPALPAPETPLASNESPQNAAWSDEVARPLVAPTRPPDHPPEPKRTIDPWAHRRGEPRIFALLWTVFLFTATGVTMLAVVARGYPTPETMQPAARALMMTVAAGLVLVWPLIRLSQQRDDRPVSGMVHDLVVVLVPVQAIVWPQTMWWLGRWPLEVVAALALEFVAWGLVVGGVIALAYATEPNGDQEPRSQGELLRRSGWMAAVAAGATLPACIPILTPGDADVRWWWMLSPVTAVAEITRDRGWSGVTAAVRPLHWWMILATAAAAGPLWVWAAGLSRRGAGVAAGAAGA